MTLTADTTPALRLIAPFLRNPEKPVILAIARPIVKKNLAALVEAYGRSPDLQQQANLIIVAGLRKGLTGAVAEQDAVLQQLFDAVDRHDLWGRVALPRHHRPEDIPSLYALAARGGVFCNPAKHEPFGLTLIEAAQAGVPLVATRSGGPGDIVRTIGAGRLVDPNDLEDIAQALRDCLADELRGKRSEMARVKACRAFDWNTWADRVQQICDDLLQPASTEKPNLSAPQNLVVCDIDGTLTGDPEGAAQFRDWVERCSRGTLFAVATGRSVSEARRVLSDWALPQPKLFITSCGTEIWRWTGAGRLSLCADYAARLAWDREAVAAGLSELPVTPQSGCEQRRWKLSYLGSVEDARLMRHQLQLMGLSARVIPSHGRFIDVLPQAAGKANAIRFEAARRAIAEEHCVVAGDSGNDADMLNAFAKAIIPSNAFEELADLKGVYRSTLPHANGVLDGMARFGLAMSAPRVLVGE